MSGDAQFSFLNGRAHGWSSDENGWTFESTLRNFEWLAKR